jgi:hypothetical protein
MTMGFFGRPRLLSTFFAASPRHAYNGDAPEVRLTHQAGRLVRMTLPG